MHLTLGHGLVAVLIEGDAPSEAPAASARPPAAPRRWAKNGHLWETCGCAECLGRREGRVPAGYGDTT